MADDYWVEGCLESLEDHELFHTHKSLPPGIDVYDMARARDGVPQQMMGVRILFGRRIHVTGDYSPGRNGIISDLGYGIGWFSGVKSPDYLCSKFAIGDEWTEDLARIDLDYHIEGLVECGGPSSLEEILALTEAKNDPYIWETGQTLYDHMSEIIPDYWDCAFGVAYNRRDYSILVAINQTFARLHEEMYPDDH